MRKEKNFFFFVIFFLLTKKIFFSIPKCLWAWLLIEGASLVSTCLEIFQNQNKKSEFWNFFFLWNQKRTACQFLPTFASAQPPPKNLFTRPNYSISDVGFPKWQVRKFDFQKISNSHLLKKFRIHSYLKHIELKKNPTKEDSQLTWRHFNVFWMPTHRCGRGCFACVTEIIWILRFSYH